MFQLIAHSSFTASGIRDQIGWDRTLKLMLSRASVQARPHTHHHLLSELSKQFPMRVITHQPASQPNTMSTKYLGFQGRESLWRRIGSLLQLSYCFLFYFKPHRKPSLSKLDLNFGRTCLGQSPK